MGADFGTMTYSKPNNDNRLERNPQANPPLRLATKRYSPLLAQILGSPARPWVGEKDGFLFFL